jgi:Trypsin-like peptidase domain
MRSACLWLLLLIWTPIAFGDGKLGTGFVISPDGYVLTNNHVISGATAIVVNVPGVGHVNAEVIAADPYKDLALLKVPYNNLPYLPIAESRNVQILDTVIVLGYPLAPELGLDISASQGQVNAVREEGRIPLLQIDANVNAGNSGGPVLNDRAEVVGVVVSRLDAFEVLKETGTIPERTNFAIPIDEARGMIRKAYPFGFNPSARSESLSPHEIVNASKGATVFIYSAEDSSRSSAPAGESSSGEVSSPTVNWQASAEAFIKTFWDHNLSNDPDGWASDFTSQSNYCYYDGKGLAPTAYLRNDRAKLVYRYPHRNYKFSPPVIHMQDGDNTAQVAYTYWYSYNGTKSASGYCRVNLTLQYIGGRWFISDYREDVFRQ